MDKAIEDIRIGVNYTVSKLERDYNPYMTDVFARGRLREQIADFIVNEKGEKLEDAQYIEYRLDLYVATPKEFWSLVNEKATELATRFQPIEIPKDK